MAQQLWRQCEDRVLLDLTRHDSHFLEFREEPGVDVRQLDEVVDAVSLGKRLENVGYAIGIGRYEIGANPAAVEIGPNDASGLERTKALEERFLKGASDRHDFTDGLHLSSES